MPIALAAPPLPSMNTFFPSISIPVSSSKDFKNPVPSVLYPFSMPSFMVTVFTAPIHIAYSSISSRYLIISTLYGLVILKPSKFILEIPLTTASKFSGITSMGMYILFKEHSLNAMFCMDEERDCPKGYPKRPNSLVSVLIFISCLQIVICLYYIIIHDVRNY